MESDLERRWKRRKKSERQTEPPALSIFPFFPKVLLPPALACLPWDAPNLSPTTFHLSGLHWVSASLSDAIPNQPGPGGVSREGVAVGGSQSCLEANAAHWGSKRRLLFRGPPVSSCYRHDLEMILFFSRQSRAASSGLSAHLRSAVVSLGADSLRRMAEWARPRLFSSAPPCPCSLDILPFRGLSFLIYLFIGIVLSAQVTPQLLFHSSRKSS